MACCNDLGCTGHGFKELTDEEILSLDFDPDFDQFLVDLQLEEVNGLGLDNVLEEGLPELDISPREEASIGENGFDCAPRSPPDSFEGCSSLYAQSGSAFPCAGNAELSGDHVEEMERENCSGASKPSVCPEELRSQRVKERNRLYAARTRQRKNRMLQDLRQKCQDLETENSNLRTHVLYLEGKLQHCLEAPMQREHLPQVQASALSSLKSSGVSSSAVHTEPCANGPTAEMQLRSSFLPSVPQRPNKPRGKAANKLRFTAAAVSGSASVNGHRPVAVVPQPCCGALGCTQHHAPCHASLQRGDAFPSVQDVQDARASVVASAVCEGFTGMSVESQASGQKRRSAIAGQDSTVSKQTKTGRYMSLTPGNKRALSPFMATSLIALAALSCLALLALPAIFMNSTAEPEQWVTPRVATEVMLDARSLPARKRALLSEPTESSALAPVGDATIVPYPHTVPSADDGMPEHGWQSTPGDWLIANTATEQVLQSAAFVCNHTACVAIPSDGIWSDVVPLQPLELRSEESGARGNLDATVFSTLKDMTPARLQNGAAHVQTNAALRGGAFGTEPADPCLQDLCESFNDVAGKAMNMAGLLAPDTCELVHRAPFETVVVDGVVPRNPEWSSAAKAGPAASASGTTHVQQIKQESMTGAVSNVDAFKSRAPRTAEHKWAGVDNSTGGSGAGLDTDQTLSVLFPMWRQDADDDGALTPMRHMYVFVVDEQDLLTYECTMARPVYM